MNNRENKLRAYTFKNPGWIPVKFSIGNSSWISYGPEEIEKLILRHKFLFPDYTEGLVDINKIPVKPYRIKGIDYIDSWGCKWKTERTGSTGVVINRPLPDWNSLDTFVPPDPDRQNGWENIDWISIKAEIAKQRSNGMFTAAGIRHGFMFLTMTYLRGFENILLDMHDGDPHLEKLIGIIEYFNEKLVEKYMALDIDMMCYPEDLGAQDRLLLSPELFRKYLKPVYSRLMSPAVDKGILVHMHSDGYVMDIIDDLAECGVSVINIQDIVNGIDDIKKHVKGKMTIDLDIDRQDVTVHGSTGDIDDLIREEVMKLGNPAGGLSLVYGFYPGTPLKNADAIMTAMEKYSQYYS